MATPARGKKRLVVDVDLELDSEVEVAAAFSRLSVSVVAKRTGESSTGDGCGFEHCTGKQRTSSKEWTSVKELTCAATSGTCFCRDGAVIFVEYCFYPNCLVNLIVSACFIRSKLVLEAEGASGFNC
jgi:hypothetical protein